ncbi:MAG TPA: hypothetical protein VK274_06820 [Pyrinomonadaceae bacterium]|nr:hypothetical protein [Pyrinomonadaceae bacterium]
MARRRSARARCLKTASKSKSSAVLLFIINIARSCLHAGAARLILEAADFAGEGSDERNRDGRSYSALEIFNHEGTKAQI